MLNFHSQDVEIEPAVLKEFTLLLANTGMIIIHMYFVQFVIKYKFVFFLANYNKSYGK